ncbi:MAG: hypothetical protein M0R73_11445 [Dehalococcoidia bacterium]|nr:hypothetical protein [Dehalococcoidia bacterium]
MLPVAAVLLVVVSAVTIRLLPTGGEVSPPASVADGTPMLVFAEFGLKADHIYLAPADAPDERTLVDTVEHADGWGINPATALAGPLVAYTVIPPTGPPERNSPAEVWVMNLETRNKTRLARDADLLVPPVFTPDGQGLLYRRSDGTQQEIVQIEVAALTRRAVHTEQTTFGMFPIGVDATGALLFARLSDGGTDLYRAHEGGETAFVYHLSDDIARDWRLSPDGRALSYLTAEFVNERVAYRARVLSLADMDSPTEAPLPATMDEGGEHYGPVWAPDGSGITVGQEALVQASEPAVTLGLDGSTSALAPAERGFDVPLGWAVGGRYLAVRWFSGTNSQNPGLDATVIVDRKGARLPVEVDTEVIFIGWYSGV